MNCLFFYVCLEFIYYFIVNISGISNSTFLCFVEATLLVDTNALDLLLEEVTYLENRKTYCVLVCGSTPRLATFFILELPFMWNCIVMEC